MFEQLIERAETADLVLIFIVWIIYKLNLRSKNGRKLDIYAIISITMIAIMVIILRAVILIIEL